MNNYAIGEVVKGKKPWSSPERHLFVAAPRRNGKDVLDIRDYNEFGQLVQIYRDGHGKQALIRKERSEERRLMAGTL